MSNRRLQGIISVHYLCKTRKECTGRWNVCDALQRIWHWSCKEILSVSKWYKGLEGKETAGKFWRSRTARKSHSQ